MVFLIKILFRNFFDELSLVIHLFKKLRSRFVVNCSGGSGIHIERDTKILKRLFIDSMEFINDFLWRNIFISRFQRNGNTMFVRAANKQHIFFF